MSLNREQRINVAKKFAEKVVEKYPKIVRSVVIFGSVVRGDFKPHSDIDLFVVIDDTIIKHCRDCGYNFIDEDNSIEKCPKCGSENIANGPSGKFLEKFDEELEKIASEMEEAKVKIKDPITGKEKIVNLLSIQPSYTLTEFWDYARIGHPIIYNFIKEGMAVYDTGFFRPLQRLWKLGKIPTTREAIEKYLEDAPKKIARARTVKLLQLAEDCYYAIVNSAQAVLMFLGKQPPVPSKLYNEFKKTLVDTGIVEEEYAKWIKEIFEIRKKIEHQELKDVKGEFVDMWLERAEKFVQKMLSLLAVLELKKLEGIVNKTYEVMRKAVMETLKDLKKPVDEKNLKEIFVKEFIDSGLLDRMYLDTWNRVEVLKKFVDEKKFDQLNPEEVYGLRENVRFLIRELEKIIKKFKKQENEEEK